MNNDVDLLRDFSTDTKEIPTDTNILVNVVAPKSMKPNQRLTKLVKTHLTKIKKQMENGDLPKPSSFFYAGSVLNELLKHLSNSHSKITENYSKHGVLAQLISFEISNIEAALNKGCTVGYNSCAHKLYLQLETNGTTYVKPSFQARKLRAG